METKLPIYECKVRDADNTGIFAISFVESPAIELNFIKLATAKMPLKFSTDKQKQILTGPVLIPDQLIYRSDLSLGEYYIKYTAADIEKISHKLMRTGLSLKTTTHEHDVTLKGNYLTEIWLIEDPKRDKSIALGTGELPKGTLMVSYKITDPVYWRDQVMTGKVLGFSLEGLFNFKNVTMTKIVKPGAAKVEPKKSNGVSAFLRSVATMLDGDTVAAVDDLAKIAAEDAVGAGTPYIIFDLADGSQIFVDDTGFCTLNDQQAPPGDHPLADGNTISIDDAGNLIVTSDAAATTTPAAAAAALAAAKQRGIEFLAALKKQKPAVNPNAAQIAKLQKEVDAAKAKITELEKEPTALKAKPTVKEGAKAPDEMTFTEKMAAVVKSRRERQDN